MRTKVVTGSDLTQLRISSLMGKIAYLRAHAERLTAADIVAELEQELRDEVQRSYAWEQSIERPTPLPHSANGIYTPDQMAAFKGAWEDVFRFHPEFLTRFVELDGLNDRDNALFELFKNDPDLKQDWREASKAFTSKWTPFFNDAQAKLVLFSKSRKVTCTLIGRVNDGDWPDSDDEYEFNEPFRFTTTVEKPLPIIRQYAADEVSIHINVTAKLVGLPGGEIVLNVTGSGEVIDDDDSAGTFTVNEQLANGQESANYRVGDDDDYGEVRFRFDLSP